jgi:hypothetical protein
VPSQRYNPAARLRRNKSWRRSRQRRPRNHAAADDDQELASAARVRRSDLENNFRTDSVSDSEMTQQRYRGYLPNLEKKLGRSTTMIITLPNNLKKIYAHKPRVSRRLELKKQSRAKNRSGQKSPWGPHAKARLPLTSNSWRASSSMSRHFTSSRVASQSNGGGDGERQIFVAAAGVEESCRRGAACGERRGFLGRRSPARKPNSMGRRGDPLPGRSARVLRRGLDSQGKFP